MRRPGSTTIGKRLAICLTTSLLIACGGNDPEKPSHATDLLCRGDNPGPAGLRLLTRNQYSNTVRDLLGDDQRLGDSFPPEHRVEGFENNSQTHQANPLLVERYWETAHELAERTAATRLDAVAPCPEADTVACAARFVQSFGTRAFRRPIEAAEHEAFLNLFRKAEPIVGYGEAIAWVLEVMLQSPQFLYRVEAESAPTETTGAVRLGPYQTASRLSYFLWDTMPDDELFRAASANQLGTAAEVEAQARRMLEHPKARAMVREFYRQWLDLGRFDGLARNQPGTTLSTLSSATLTSLRQSLLTFLEFAHFDGEGTFESLFTSGALFVNNLIGPFYGITDAPTDGRFIGKSMRETRSGLLTQPAFLTLLSHADQSSPIQRGVFVRSQLLCDPPLPPPPTVNNNPPDPDPSLTTRERFRVHTEEPVCANCHIEIDNIGFGFENYDHLGRYRAEESGQPIDSSGQVVNAPDPALDGSFIGLTELSQRLGQSKLVRDCMVTHWYRYTMGRIETEADRCSVQQAQQHLADHDGDLRELLVGLALTDAFRFRPPHEGDQP